MSAIHSVEAAKAAFPHLKWRDAPSANGKGKIAFAIVGGNKATGDNTIFLAMENGAKAPLHTHRMRTHRSTIWPFRESLTMLIGELHDVFGEKSGVVLVAGNDGVADLGGDDAHAPSVPDGGFALLIYRQPAGSDAVTR